MEKSEFSKSKDRKRLRGKVFVPEPSTWDKRVTASGVTFGGKYTKFKKKKQKGRS